MISSLVSNHSSQDVIHIHLPNPMANLALWIARPKGKVVVFWHSDILKQVFLMKIISPLQTWLLSRADAIIVASQCYADSSSCLSKWKNKIHIAPYGIDDTVNNIPTSEMVFMSKSIRERWPNKRIIFSLGRLVYYKGFHKLIEAASYLPDDVVVLIGGSGTLANDLQDQINRLGLESKVYLLGHLSDSEISSFFEAAEIFCLPSIYRSEAFGVVLIEAMMYSKPIVTFNIEGSGVSWVNQHGVSGLNAVCGDVTSLTSCIMALLDNPELCRSLGKKGRLRFESNFTREKYIDSIEEIHRLIL